jgi:hypothetical protein
MPLVIMVPNGKYPRLVFMPARPMTSRNPPSWILENWSFWIHSLTKGFVKWNCSQSGIYLKWQLTFKWLKNGHSSITECSDGILKILSRNLILLIVAQYCYVRFSNNKREHFRLQINSWLGAISFDKAFTMMTIYWSCEKVHKKHKVTVSCHLYLLMFSWELRTLCYYNKN